MHKKVIFLLSGILAVFCLLACASGASGIKAGGLSVEEADIEVLPQLGHTDLVNSVAFSPDGKLALSGACDNNIILWEIDTGRQKRIFTGHTSWVETVCFSPDGKQFLSNSGNTIKQWDVETGQEIRTFAKTRFSTA